MRVSRSDELGESERGEAGPLTEQHRDGVGDELAGPAGGEVPLVAGADLFGVEALGQPAEHGFDPPAGLHEPSRPGRRLGGLSARRRDQVEAIGAEFRPQRRAPVAAVAQSSTLQSGEELGRDRPVGVVRRRQRGRGDHAGPSDDRLLAILLAHADRELHARAECSSPSTGAAAWSP